MIALKFFRKYGLSILFLVIAPIAALVFAWSLVSHTNWMTYDTLNVRLWPAIASGSEGNFVLHGLLFCSIMLVLINTLSYGSDAWENREPVVAILYGVSLVIIVIWAIEVYSGLLTRWLHSSDWSRHIHDVFAFIVFVMFSVMDFRLYVKVRGNRQTVAVSQVNPQVKEQTFLLQFWMVDVPIVVSILVVNCFLHQLLETSPALGYNLWAVGYLAGFGSGALLMQLALSQFVFLIIYTRYFMWEYRSMASAVSASTVSPAVSSCPARS